MSWHESTCPVCSKDTSGILPIIIYYNGERYRLFPCMLHGKAVDDPDWQKSYFESDKGKLEPESQTFGCL